MKKLEKLAQLTDEQLCYGVLKYLGYAIYVRDDLDESSPHKWPGDAVVRELANVGAIVTIDSQGDLRVEAACASFPITLQNIIANHLNDLVGRAAVRQITVDNDDQYTVGTYMGMDKDMTCHVHGNDLYKALCYGFLLYHCGGALDVPDVLVKD